MEALASVIYAGIFFALGWLWSVVVLPGSRWRRRYAGEVGADKIVVVLDDLHYTVKSDREQKSHIELIASAKGDWEDPQQFRVSVKSPAQSDVADAAHAIYRAGRMQVVMRPFVKESQSEQAQNP